MPERSTRSHAQPLLVQDLEATVQRFSQAFNLRFHAFSFTSEAGSARPGFLCRHLTRGIQPVVLLQALPHEDRHPLDLTVLHPSPNLALHQALASGFLPVMRPRPTGRTSESEVTSVRDPDNHLMVDIEAAFDVSAHQLP